MNEIETAVAKALQQEALRQAEPEGVRSGNIQKIKEELQKCETLLNIAITSLKTIRDLIKEVESTDNSRGTGMRSGGWTSEIVGQGGRTEHGMRTDVSHVPRTGMKSGGQR